MNVVDMILAALPTPDARVLDVRVGPFWTVVWTDHGAGLASTQSDAHEPHGTSAIRWAGQLTDHSALDLAGLLRSESLMEAAIGMATVNAISPVPEDRLTDRNAAAEIIERGVGRRVAIVGHFPFVPEVRVAVGHLDVLELSPRDGDLPANSASEIIPHADVVAISGTTLVNGTFDGLIHLCRPGAYVIVLGPTTPLSPVLFDCGVDLIAGTVVVNPKEALQLAGQGAIFRQMRGVRLVTMARSV